MHDAALTKMAEVLITGANGFIGRRLCTELLRHGETVRSAVRIAQQGTVVAGRLFTISDINASTDWQAALAGVDLVVHLAARAHVLKDVAADPLVEFRRVNAEGTLNLARQAAAAGVRRFVFISSIGVNGAETKDAPFTEKDTAHPHSPYAISKHEAELGLRQIAGETKLEVVIIRPPLVFGPDAPGNFGQLVRAVRRRIPLPLGSIWNRRSFVALDNLIDLIETCLYHPQAANQTFLVSDGEDLSTTLLLRRLGQALGKTARLVPVPSALIKIGAALLGRQDVAQRLCGSLQVDISKARELLGWSPPISVDEGLRRTARGF